MNMKNCGFDEQLISYLYDELDFAEREKFEQHLQSCESCTEELKALGETRFAISEWRQNDFDILPTPKVAIPAQNTWLDSWANLLSLRWLALASACLLILFGLIMMKQNQNQEIALSNTEKEIPTTKEITIDEEAIITTEKPLSELNQENIKVSSKKISEMKTKSKTQPRKNKILKPAQEKEIFADFPESQEEENVRLIDLFDEIGGV
jgi:predicted anti-sigma-YlaC factor YlaD